ncbi:BLUF domain-containing protein, partial [Kosakonia oryzendophytica]|uniref:BLUF domain-containing protein n=1 Tax=Kosakonia oryzendophytica TaxID=1005665 RepID=UPI0020165C7A
MFDGDHFLQVLEGPLASVNAVFERIKRDHRHGTVVELLRDFAPRRPFVDRGMPPFDLRVMKPAAAQRAIPRV